MRPRLFALALLLLVFVGCGGREDDGDTLNHTHAPGCPTVPQSCKCDAFC